MPRKKSSTPPKDEPGFEEAVAELEKIVSALEEDSLPLEEMVERFEQGTNLLRRCEEVLGSARKRLKTIAARDSAASSPDASDDTDASDEHDEIRLF